MSLKRILFLSLMLLLLCSSAFAATEKDIHESGFRDLNWGESLDSLQQKGNQFTEYGFDNHKKLYTYMRFADSYSIYGTGCYPIYYYFWDGKLVAIRTYFNAERDSDAFQRLYNAIVVDFGVSQKLPARTDDEETLSWQDGQTTVRMTYNMLTKAGSLYLFNTKLQTDYAAFLKTAEPPDYQNQPDGFNSINWGTDMKDLQTQGKKFKANKNESILGDYTLDKAENTLLGLPVIRTTYSFWQKQFCAAYVYYQSVDEKSTFNSLYEKLCTQYGAPLQGRYSEADRAYQYIWPGDVTYIMLYHFPNQKESYIFFASKELYDQQSAK